MIDLLLFVLIENRMLTLNFYRVRGFGELSRNFSSVNGLYGFRATEERENKLIKLGTIHCALSSLMCVGRIAT